MDLGWLLPTRSSGIPLFFERLRVAHVRYEAAKSPRPPTPNGWFPQVSYSRRTNMSGPDQTTPRSQAGHHVSFQPAGTVAGKGRRDIRLGLRLVEEHRSGSGFQDSCAGCPIALISICHNMRPVGIREDAPTRIQRVHAGYQPRSRRLARHLVCVCNNRRVYDWFVETR